MDPNDRDEVERLMAAMAAGDAAAVFTLIATFGGRLAAAVRRQLLELGRRDVAANRADVDFLVQSAAFVLLDRAASWSPGGALPWTWAERAIRAEVVAFVGHPSDDIDPDLERSDVAPRSARPADDDDDFEVLAGIHPEVALLSRAIEQVASIRDRQVHIQYRIQKRSGDRSPAHTVAAEFGLSPANVRQIDLRVGRRLRALIESDPGFGGLDRLEWLAA